MGTWPETLAVIITLLTIAWRAGVWMRGIEAELAFHRGLIYVLFQHLGIPAEMAALVGQNPIGEQRANPAGDIATPIGRIALRRSSGRY